MRGLKVANLVASMSDLFDAAAAHPAGSPLAALQAYAHGSAAAPQPDPSQVLSCHCPCSVVCAGLGGRAAARPFAGPRLTMLRVCALSRLCPGMIR